MEFDEFGNPVYPDGVKILSPYRGSYSSSPLAALGGLGPMASGYGFNQSRIEPMNILSVNPQNASTLGTDYANKLEYLDRLRQMSNPKWSEMGTGQKIGTVGTGLQALSALGGAYLGFKNLSLAKKQFNMQNQYAAVNLANQAKTANQALEENIRSRYAGGQTAAEAEELAKYRLQGTVGGKG